MKILFTFLGLMTPAFALAQSGTFETTITKLTQVSGQLVPLLMSFAIVMFFWGIVKFIANMDDESARAGGKHLMVWGMIAIFVMTSFWGIIGYVQNSLGLEPIPIQTGTAPTMTNPIPSVNP